MNAGSQGPAFQEISAAAFAEFTARHGVSPEVGRIGTYLDESVQAQPSGTLRLTGLTGCGKLCAVSSWVIAKSKIAEAHVGKLDAVVVDQRLRKRGLATVLVADCLVRLMADPDYGLAAVYSHAVHPATRRVLRQLSFSEPPPVGAPLAVAHIDDTNRGAFGGRCKRSRDSILGWMKLQCELCASRDGRARPWCVPSDREGRERPHATPFAARPPLENAPAATSTGHPQRGFGLPQLFRGRGRR